MLLAVRNARGQGLGAFYIPAEGYDKYCVERSPDYCQSYTLGLGTTDSLLLVIKVGSDAELGIVVDRQLH